MTICIKFAEDQGAWWLFFLFSVLTYSKDAFFHKDKQRTTIVFTLTIAGRFREISVLILNYVIWSKYACSWHHCTNRAHCEQNNNQMCNGHRWFEINVVCLQEDLIHTVIDRDPFLCFGYSSHLDPILLTRFSCYHGRDQYFAPLLIWVKLLIHALDSPPV